MKQKSDDKVNQSTKSSTGHMRERTRSNEYYENNWRSYTHAYEKQFRKEEAQSPRGRKVANSSSYYKNEKKMKPSDYRNSSSNSTYRFTDRRVNKLQNSYNSDSISDHDMIANMTSKMILSTQTKIPKSCPSEDLSVEYTSPDTQAEKASCNCSSCRQAAGSDYSEEQSLSKEIFQIICDIYEAHIKNQEIKETVRRYQQSVYEFCSKESQADIIYLVKLFTKMLSNALAVF